MDFKLSKEDLKKLDSAMEKVSSKMDLNSKDVMYAMSDKCKCGGNCAGSCSDSCVGGCSGHFTIG